MNIFKNEKAVVLCIFLLLVIPMSYVQDMRWISGQGDTAFLAQMVENIAERGTAVCQVSANILAAVPYWSMPADAVCGAPLGPPKEQDINQFTRHAYFILYAIAPMKWIIPVNILLPSINVLGFLIMLLIAYILLRKNNVPIAGAALFCLLVSVHPAWSQSIFGQTYVDRYFLPLGTLFLFVLSGKDMNRLWIILIGIFAVAISERVGMTIGIIAMVYALLYRERTLNDRFFIFAVGLGFAAYSYILMKFYIVNSDYNSFLHSISANFQYPGFVDKLKVFVLFNMLFMGIFAIFDWRAFLLAIMSMMPNILGNIGGAEKTGWLTHYHSLYFPVLVWASAMGFMKLMIIMDSSFKRRILYLSTFFLIILCSSTFLYLRDSNTPRFSLVNIKENVWVKTGGILYDFALHGNASYLGFIVDRARAIQQIVPPHTSVTTSEGMMPALYRNRTIYYYPMGIDVADYAVLQAQTGPDGHVIYIGAISYLGEENRRNLDICLNERMKKAGYDLNNPVMIGNIAILRRLSDGNPSLRANIVE